MQPKILLTSDRTWMSDYSGIIFLGFATCFPKGFVPDSLFFSVFAPPVEQKDGIVKYAPYGLRKIEALLLENGFKEEDIAVVSPDHIGRYIKHAKVVGIAGNDIMGKGPTTRILTQLMDVPAKKAYSAYMFDKLYHELQKYKKKHQFKTILGGPGAWQILGEGYDIDSVIIGEAENVAADVFRKAMNGEELPKIVEGTVVDTDDIPLIKKPSICGLVEITRGCGRGCRFCTPTMRAFRCYPVKKVIDEVKVNLRAGHKGIILHGEDVLRYKANGFRVNCKEVERLFTEVAKIAKPENIGMSHIALSSALQEPGLIENISEMLNIGSKEYPWTSAQTGVESAGSGLIEKYMQGKTLPYKASEWRDVVIESFKMLHDNNWAPCATLIMGLPGEKQKDITQTIELVEDLRSYRSLIIPLYYVPMDNVKIGKAFSKDKMTYEHWELLAVSVKHSTRWMKDLAKDMLRLKAKEMPSIPKFTLERTVAVWERSVTPYLDRILEGEVRVPRNMPETLISYMAKKPMGKVLMKKSE